MHQTVLPLTTSEMGYVKIVKRGDSAAARLSAAALARAGLNLDDAVEITAQDDEIVMRRQLKRLTMTELLATFDPQNIDISFNSI